MWSLVAFAMCAALAEGVSLSKEQAHDVLAYRNAEVSATEGGVFPLDKVRFIGRWYSVGGEMRHGWGASFMLRFRGSSTVRAEIRNVHSDALYFVCQVDGEEVKKPHKEGIFTIATGLSSSEHTVRCGRSNEGSYGETALIVIKLDPGAEALSPPSGENELRYEAIGDSITAGFAVEESAGSTAGATLANSDVWQTYERYIADGWATNDLSVVARSGIAVTDYGGEVVMKERWTCQNYVWGPCSGAWVFNGWQADVVTINLGTNDYVFGNPTPALFEAEYETLVSLVRSKYPNALIACIAPLVYSCFSQFQKWQNAVKSIEAVVDMFNKNGDAKVKFYSTGDGNDKWLVCEQDYVDYTHPTTLGNQKFAAKLLQKMTPDVRALFPSKCLGSGDTCTPSSPSFTPSPSGASLPAPTPSSTIVPPAVYPSPAQASASTSGSSSGWKLWVGGSAGLSAGLCATPGCGGSYTKKYNVDACKNVGYKLQGNTVVEPAVLPWPHGQGAQPALNECSNPDQLRRDTCPNILKFADVWQPTVDGRTFTGTGDNKLIQGYGHAFTQVADNLPCGFCAAMRSKRVLGDGGWNYMIMMRIDVTDDISPEVDEVTAEFGQGVVPYPTADRIPFEYKVVSCETGQATGDFSPAPVPASPASASPAPTPPAPAPTPPQPAPAPAQQAGGSGGACANAAYAQCGGSGFAGDACCPVGHYCAESNQWWSQCMPCTAGSCPTSGASAGSPSPSVPAPAPPAPAAQVAPSPPPPAPQVAPAPPPPTPQVAPSPPPSAQPAAPTPASSGGWKLWVGGSAGLSAGLCATPGCGGSYTKKYNVDACKTVGYKLQGSTVQEPAVLPWPHGQGAQPALNECSNPDQLRRDTCPNILKFADVWQPNVDGRTFSGAGDSKLIQGFGHAFTQVADGLPCGFCAAMRSKRVLGDGGYNYMIMMRIDVTDDISPEVDEVTAEFGEGVVRYPTADRIPFEYKIVSCETGQAAGNFGPAPTPPAPAPSQPAPAPSRPAPAPTPPASSPSTGSCSNGERAQCGGKTFTGATCCPAGSWCKTDNDWWHQCTPCGEAWDASCGGSLAQANGEVRKHGFLAPILLHLRATLAKHVPVPTSWTEKETADADEL